jgi:hypothetical protein
MGNGQVKKHRRPGLLADAVGKLLKWLKSPQALKLPGPSNA